MLRVMRQGQRWIMIATIVLVGGAFVFFLGSGGSLLEAGPGPGMVVTVGEQDFDARAFMRMRQSQEAQYREILGDQFDARAASDQLDMATVNVIVQRAIFAAEGRRLGLRATDEEVRDLIRSFDRFKNGDGTFNRQEFDEFVEYEYGSERAFVEVLREDVLVQKTAALLAGSAEVSDGEARDAVRFGREEVRLAYVALDPKAAPPNLEVSDAQVEEFLAGEVERVRALYDEQQTRWSQPERVRARHILKRVPADAEEGVVRGIEAAMLALKKQVEDGADFAELAEAESEDTASAVQGGDLGLFARGRMVKEFEDTAFSLEPGTVSDPVRTNFGFHLILVEEKKAAEATAFDEAKNEIARELIEQEAGAEYASALRERLLGAIGEGRSLEEAARSEGLTLERTNLLRRREDGYVPELGPAPELLDAAFALREDAPSAPEAFEVAEKQVLIQLLERREPSDDEIAQQLEATREQLLDTKRRQVETAWIEARRQDLQESGRLLVNLEVLRSGP